MMKKDYCQLQFGVILSFLICLSQAHTVLNSTLGRSSLNETDYEDWKPVVNGKVLDVSNHNLTEYYESWPQHAPVTEFEDNSNQRYLDESNYNFTQYNDNWTPGIEDVYEDNAQNEIDQEDSKLLDEIFNNCRPPTIRCLKKSIATHLRNIIENAPEITVTDFMKLRKRDDINSTLINDRFMTESESVGSRGFFDNTANLLNAEATKFFMSHNLELRVPRDLLKEANITNPEIGFEGDDAIIVMEMMPRSLQEIGEGRIFKKKIKALKKSKLLAVLAIIGIVLLKILKHIKKWFGNKLGVALGAIMLVVALVKAVLMFILPTILGVASAKKFLLKMVLFVFPFLTHIFKLCPFYPQGGHGTKYHHHHHQIAHYHNIHVPHGGHHHGIELDHPPPGYGHHDDDLGYYSDGPSGYDYGHRKTDHKYPQRLSPEDNEIETWSRGKGQSTSPSRYPPSGHATKPPVTNANKVLTPTEIENLVLKAEKEALLKARLQEEQKRVQAENKRLQDQILQAKKVQEALKMQKILSGKGISLGSGLSGNPNRLMSDLLNIPPVSPVGFGHPSAHGLTSHGPSSHGLSGHGLSGHGLSSHGLSGHGLSGHGLSGHGPSGHGFSSHGPSSLGLTSHGLTSHGTSGHSQAASYNIPKIVPHPLAVQHLAQHLQHSPGNKPLHLFSNPTGGQNLKHPNQVFLPAYDKSSSVQQQNLVAHIANKIRANNIVQQQLLQSNLSNIQQQVIQNNVQQRQPSSVQQSVISNIVQERSQDIDPFYSPILERIDKLLVELGYEHEGCRERLICSMYKNPTKFSPHSNLLSAELSRDASELQKPTSTNSVVVRFYKYVQAARDGQDRRDCLRLYPACSINTD